MERLREGLLKQKTDLKIKGNYSGPVKIFLSNFIKLFLVFWAFYKSIYVIIPVLIVTCFLMKPGLKAEIEKEKWELTVEFKDGLQGISAALNAGYSLENSFVEAVSDLNMLYGGNSKLKPYFEKVVIASKLNIPIEESIREIADDTGVDDIYRFSEIISIAKRMGGDIRKITISASEKICQKIELSREIKTLIAAKKMESTIMTLIPFAIIIYLQLTSPGFMDGMYSGFSGRALMTGCLLVYFVAVILSRKITSIKI